MILFVLIFYILYMNKLQRQDLECLTFVGFSCTFISHCSHQYHQ